MLIFSFFAAYFRVNRRPYIRLFLCLSTRMGAFLSTRLSILYILIFARGFGRFPFNGEFIGKSGLNGWVVARGQVYELLILFQNSGYFYIL